MAATAAAFVVYSSSMGKPATALGGFDSRAEATAFVREYVARTERSHDAKFAQHRTGGQWTWVDGRETVNIVGGHRDH